MKTKQSNNSATPMANAVKIANQRALFSLEWENDTVFKKRELNYKTKAAFQKDLEAGKISKYTTVFIKDSKEIYKNGQYYGAGSSSEETSDTIINISSLEITTGTLSGVTHNEIVDCIKRNGNIKVRINMDGTSCTFTPISCVYIEESNLVTISIDTSLMQYANAYTKIVTLTIVNDNSYTISSVDKSIICGDFTNNGDILIDLSYKGLSGQEETRTNIILEKTGNGTKFLSDNGEYKEVNSYYKLTDKFYQLTNKSTSEDIKNAIGGDSGFESFKSAIKSHTRIFCEFKVEGIEYCGELQCSYSNIQGMGEMIAISMLGYAPFMVDNSAASCAVLTKINNEYYFQTGIMGELANVYNI